MKEVHLEIIIPRTCPPYRPLGSALGVKYLFYQNFKSSQLSFNSPTLVSKFNKQNISTKTIAERLVSVINIIFCCQLL